MLETEQKFLSFHLGTKDTAVMSLQHITEVLQVPLTEICGVPQMPSCVLGIYNWRGEMLWLVDLEDMLGYTPLSHSTNSLTRMMAIVIQKDGKYLGLLVRQILDIEWLDVKRIKNVDNQLFSSQIIPFIQGYFINDKEEMITYIDAQSVIRAPMWDMYN